MSSTNCYLLVVLFLARYAQDNYMLNEMVYLTAVFNKSSNDTCISLRSHKTLDPTRF